MSTLHAPRPSVKPAPANVATRPPLSSERPYLAHVEAPCPVCGGPSILAGRDVNEHGHDVGRCWRCDGSAFAPKAVEPLADLRAAASSSDLVELLRVQAMDNAFDAACAAERVAGIGFRLSVAGRAAMEQSP